MVPLIQPWICRIQPCVPAKIRLTALMCSRNQVLHLPYGWRQSPGNHFQRLLAVSPPKGFAANLALGQGVLGGLKTDVRPPGATIRLRSISRNANARYQA